MKLVPIAPFIELSTNADTSVKGIQAAYSPNNELNILADITAKGIQTFHEQVKKT